MLRKTNDVRTIVCIKLRLPLEFKREGISCGNKNLRGHCERCLNWELFFHIHRLFIYFFFPHGIWKGLTWSISHIPQTVFFLSCTSCTLFVSPVCDSNFNEDLSAQRALFIEIMSFQQNAFFSRYARRDIYLKCKFLDRMQQNWRSLAVDARPFSLFIFILKWVRVDLNIA